MTPEARSKMNALLASTTLPSPTNEGEGRAFWNAFRPVGPSPDLDRVLALPRRPGRVEERVDEHDVEVLSEILRRPGSQYRLRPIQVSALVEAAENNGLLGPIGVGAGKTLISILAPVVMSSKVAVLLVPPALRSKLVDVEYPALQKEFRLPALVGHPVRYGDEPGVLHVISHAALSSQRTSNLLEEIKPDLVVIDEAHAFKDQNSARTKRLFRYLRAHPEVRLVALSGSMTSKSLMDFWNLARFALRAGAPVPLEWPVAMEWAAALDASGVGSPPGELMRFVGPEDEAKAAEEEAREGKAPNIARIGYQRRLRETPGVVATGSEILPIGLTIFSRDLPLPPAVASALDNLRATNETPGGEELSYSLDLVRYGCQLAAGFYTRWVWPRGEPPDVIRAWKDARREFRKEIREYLKHSAKPELDSPGFLEAAAHRWHFGYEVDGVRYPPHTKDGPRVTWASATYERWHEVEPSASPQDEVVWIDDFMIRDAISWGREAPGIIWAAHRDLGRRIAAEGGFRYFGAGKEASEELPRLAASKAAGRDTIVCSMNAHYKGHNLQAWSRMLVTTFQASSEKNEQLLGRCHREGQEADEVIVDTYVHTPEMMRSFCAAVESARYVEEVLGSRQKLCYCTISFPVSDPNGTPERGENRG